MSDPTTMCELTTQVLMQPLNDYLIYVSTVIFYSLLALLFFHLVIVYSRYIERRDFHASLFLALNLQISQMTREEYIEFTRDLNEEFLAWQECRVSERPGFFALIKMFIGSRRKVLPD